MVNPSHQRSDLSSWRSSTTAVAMARSPSNRPGGLVRFLSNGRSRLVVASVIPVCSKQSHSAMPQILDRTRDGARPPTVAHGRVGPVVLGTLAVRIAADAERVAIESALETGVPLVIASMIT